MASLASLLLCPLAAFGLLAAPPATGRRKGFPDGTLEAVYVNPDPSVWLPMDLGSSPDPDLFNLTLRHTGIRDVRGVDVQPVMSMTARKLPAPDGVSLEDFSAYLMGRTPMKDPRMETRDGRTYVSATVVYGGYTHIIRRAFVVRGRIGLDLICDSTDTVFEKVREDFERWVATVALEPRIVPVPVRLPAPPMDKDKGVINVYTHDLEKQEPGGELKGDCVAMKVEGGMAIYWNASKPYFRLLVEGHAFHGFSEASRLAFTADGAFLQLVCTQASEFCPNHASLSPEQVLLAHRDWEFRYLEETVGVPCQLRSWAGTLADGTPVLYWDFTPAKTPGKELPRHVFCTRYREGVVIGLSSVEEDKTSLERAMDLVFSGTAATQFSSTPYDLARIQKQERDQAGGAARKKSK